MYCISLLNSVSELYKEKVLSFEKSWLSGQDFFEINTSGSTGKPKSIALSREQMIASATITGKTFGLAGGDVAFCCLNIEMIAGMMMMVRASVLQLRVVVAEPSSNPIKDLPDDILPDFYAFVPLQIQSILTETPNFISKLNKAKAIIIGGAAVGEQLLTQLQQITAPVYATYGMTETVSHIAIRRLNGEASEPYFSVLEGVEIDIDTRDCLKIKADATNHKWIQTNDVVNVIDSKNIVLVGRADNIINSGGVKIQLEKVEQLIDIQAIVSGFLLPRFFVFGLPHERLGTHLVLFVEGANVDFPKNFFSSFPKYHVPKEIFFVEKFRETASGKIDKYQTVQSSSLG
jgi:o-succinylbenzoate---CoA ligase